LNFRQTTKLRASLPITKPGLTAGFVSSEISGFRISQRTIKIEENMPDHRFGWAHNSTSTFFAI
jgi:hypothetical protein